jgi:hypothetical protein
LRPWLVRLVKDHTTRRKREITVGKPEQQIDLKAENN